MKTNNTVRDKANYYWLHQISDFGKYTLCSRYYPNGKSYNELNEMEIEHIYLSEHPQSKDTVPDENGFYLWDKVKPAHEQEITFWYDGEKRGKYNAKRNEVIGHHKLPKYWKPVEDTVPVQVEGFTGGEWEAKYNTELFPNQAAIYGDYGDENGRVIAVMDISDETDMANIDLVCNAPAMYAALKEFVNFDLRKSDFAFADKDDINGIMDIITKAKAIINNITKP